MKKILATMLSALALGCSSLKQEVKTESPKPLEEVEQLTSADSNDALAVSCFENDFQGKAKISTISNDFVVVFDDQRRKPVIISHNLAKEVDADISKMPLADASIYIQFQIWVRYSLYAMKEGYNPTVCLASGDLRHAYMFENLVFESRVLGGFSISDLEETKLSRCIAEMYKEVFKNYKTELKSEQKLYGPDSKEVGERKRGIEQLLSNIYEYGIRSSLNMVRRWSQDSESADNDPVPSEEMEELRYEAFYFFAKEDRPDYLARIVLYWYGDFNKAVDYLRQAIRKYGLEAPDPNIGLNSVSTSICYTLKEIFCYQRDEEDREKLDSLVNLTAEKFENWKEFTAVCR